MTTVDHKARGHARFGASSAARWFACPGSVALCDRVPARPSGAAADEGTRAHELLEVLLRCSAECRSDEAHEYLGAASQEMKDAVLVAFDYVQDILAHYPDAVMLVEHPFEIPVATAPGEVWGTCDVVIFVPSLRLLYVVDYKHGAGVHVDVRGNKQLRFYGLGALASRKQDWLGVPCSLCGGHGNEPDEPICGGCGNTGEAYGHAWNADTVALVIVQPRCAVGQPVREEWLPIEDLLEFGKELGRAVEAAKAPNAPLVPGEEQCRFCPAKTACPARERQAFEVAGASFAHVARVGHVVQHEARELSGDYIADVLDAKDLIVSWLEAVEAEAAERIRAGGAVRGRKLVEARARREWDDDSHESARKLGEIAACAPDVFMARRLRGLSEVEALLKKGVNRAEARRRLDAMAFLTTRKSSGKLVLAPESDPRPAAGAGAFADVRQLGTQP